MSLVQAFCRGCLLLALVASPAGAAKPTAAPSLDDVMRRLAETERTFGDYRMELSMKTSGWGHPEVRDSDGTIVFAGGKSFHRWLRDRRWQNGTTDRSETIFYEEPGRLLTVSRGQKGTPDSNILMFSDAPNKPINADKRLNIEKEMGRPPNPISVGAIGEWRGKPVYEQYWQDLSNGVGEKWSVVMDDKLVAVTLNDPIPPPGRVKDTWWLDPEHGMLIVKRRAWNREGDALLEYDATLDKIDGRDVTTSFKSVDYEPKNPDKIFYTFESRLTKLTLPGPKDLPQIGWLRIDDMEFVLEQNAAPSSKAAIFAFADGEIVPHVLVEQSLLPQDEMLAISRVEHIPSTTSRRQTSAVSDAGADFTSNATRESSWFARSRSFPAFLGIGCLTIAAFGAYKTLRPQPRV